MAKQATVLVRVVNSEKWQGTRNVLATRQPNGRFAGPVADLTNLTNALLERKV